MSEKWDRHFTTPPPEIKKERAAMHEHDRQQRELSNHEWSGQWQRYVMRETHEYEASPLRWRKLFSARGPTFLSLFPSLPRSLFYLILQYQLHSTAVLHNALTCSLHIHSPLPPITTLRSPISNLPSISPPWPNCPTPPSLSSSLSPAWPSRLSAPLSSVTTTHARTKAGITPPTSRANICAKSACATTAI